MNVTIKTMLKVRTIFDVFRRETKDGKSKQKLYQS